MRSNVIVFKRDMIGARSLPPILTAAALVKVFPLQHELGQPRDAPGDQARLIGRYVIVREADAFEDRRGNGRPWRH